MILLKIVQAFVEKRNNEGLFTMLSVDLRCLYNAVNTLTLLSDDTGIVKNIN